MRRTAKKCIWTAAFIFEMEPQPESYAPGEPSAYDQLEGLNYDVDELSSLLGTLRQKVPSGLVDTVQSLSDRFEKLAAAWQGFCFESYEEVAEEQRKVQAGLRRKQSQDTERRRNIIFREAEVQVKEKEFQSSLHRVQELYKANSSQLDAIFQAHRSTHLQLKQEGENRLKSVEREMNEALGPSPPHPKRGFKLDLDNVKPDDQRKLPTSGSDVSCKYSADRTVHGSPGDEDLVSHRSAFIDDGDISARRASKDDRVLRLPIQPRLPKGRLEPPALDKSDSSSWSAFDKAYDEMHKGQVDADAGGNISLEKQQSAWDSKLESESETSGVAPAPNDIAQAIKLLVENGIISMEEAAIDPNSTKEGVSFIQLFFQMADLFSKGLLHPTPAKALDPANARNYNAPFAPSDNFRKRRVYVQELADISHISHAEEVSDFAATSPKNLRMFIGEDPMKTMLSSEQVSSRNMRQEESRGDVSRELEELLACDYSSQEGEGMPETPSRSRDFGLHIPAKQQSPRASPDQ